MVEYGNGVSQVAGKVGGGSGSTPVDLGTSIGQFVTSSVHSLQAMPPAELLGVIVVVVIGLLILKRAF